MLYLPNDILIYNITPFLTVLDIIILYKCCVKFNIIFKNIMLKNIKISKSINSINNVFINSYLYQCILNNKNCKLKFPEQIKNGFVEIIFDNCLEIVIYENIYSPKYTIFDYFQKMKKYKVHSII